MSIHQEDITIINIYAINIGAPKYIKEILTYMKGEIYNNAIIVGDFNTPLSSMNRKSIRTHYLLNYSLDHKPNRYIQNIPSNSSRVHIFLNNLQDSSCVNSTQN